MSKKRVTFHRMITGVESVTLMVDGDIDLKTITSDEAYDIVQESFDNNTAFVDMEILENEYPHAVTSGKDYLDFAEING